MWRDRGLCSFAASVLLHSLQVPGYRAVGNAGEERLEKRPAGCGFRPVCMEDCSQACPLKNGMTRPVLPRTKTAPGTHTGTALCNMGRDSNAAGFYTSVCQLADLAWPCQRGGLGQEVSGKQELMQKICNSAGRLLANICQLTYACRADGQGKPG